MHAHEILEAMRGAGIPRNVLVAEFDRGSVEDQLWEEHAFYRSHLNPAEFVTFYQEDGRCVVEVLRFRKDGGIVYMRLNGEPQKYYPTQICNLVTSKREELGL